MPAVRERVFVREDFLTRDRATIIAELEQLSREFPLVPHTSAGFNFSTVRRMKAENSLGLPIRLRTGAAISVKTGKAANDMTAEEWEEFYNALKQNLCTTFPELFARLFPAECCTDPDTNASGNARR